MRSKYVHGLPGGWLSGAFRLGKRLITVGM